MAEATELVVETHHLTKIYQNRQIALNDVMKSSYRVRDHQITEVTRTAGNSPRSISA